MGSRLWAACAAASLAWAFARAAPATNAQALPASDLPAPVARAPAPVYSRDQSFVILSSAAQADYRLPVLQFAEELRRSLAQTLKIQLGTSAAPVTIMIGDTPGETGVIARRLQNVPGIWREQIEIGDPERVDLMELRVALARALLRVWLVAAAGPGGAPTLPPDWFLRGMVRAPLRSERLNDLENVLQFWSRGRLPPATDLLAADPAEGMREPALSALLVAWMSEREGGGARMRGLMQHLAAGGAWSADSLLPILWPALTAARVDEEWDRWLVARSRAILEPGVTTAGMLRRFRMQLALYPADFNIPLADGWRARTPEELLPYAGEPWMKPVAEAKAAQVRLAAVGRDGTLHAVAEAYAGFFTSLAQREPSGILKARLSAAERLLVAAEAAMASGNVLREPVPSKQDATRKKE